MNDERLLERAARSWLETGPTEAPARAVDAALALVQTTSQERDWNVPRRVNRMFAPARVAAAATIAVLLIGGVLLIARPGSNGVGRTAASPSPSSTPSSPAALAPDGDVPVLDRTFTSSTFGYVVQYPGAWNVAPATQRWDPSRMNHSSWTSDAGTSDVLGVVPWFEGRSMVLPAGQRFEVWYAAYAATRAAATCGGSPAREETVVVAGIVGRLDRHCEEYFLEAVVPTAGRVYVFTLYEPNALPAFASMLDTIVLTPPSEPALDATLTSTMNGFSVRYPGAWTNVPATLVWAVDDYANSNQALSDVLGDGRMFMGGSTLMAPGESFEHWFAQYDAYRLSSNCSAPSLEEAVTVDGLPGFLDRHCPTDYLEVVVAKGNRVYVFTTWTPDAVLFSSMLDTVRLTPTTATP